MKGNLGKEDMMMTIRPIHDAEAHRSALDVIGNIMALEAPDEADLALLETLAVLVERYEETAFPLDRPSRSMPFAFAWTRWA